MVVSGCGGYTDRVEVVPASVRNVTIHNFNSLQIAKSCQRSGWTSLMFGCPEVRGHAHTLSRAAVISRAGPQRNCLWIFQVFTSWTNLEQHRFSMRRSLYSVFRTTSHNFPGQKRVLSVYMLAEPWRRDVANDLQLQARTSMCNFSECFEGNRVVFATL